MRENARSVALQALLQVEENEGYSNIVIDKALRAAGLDARDGALFTDYVADGSYMLFAFSFRIVQAGRHGFLPCAGWHSPHPAQLPQPPPQEQACLPRLWLR